ncbi:MAG TPA: PVC-type heme-binding CxxCH protein [Tepidisphaeraceae bacterium]|jgi:putative heme-binding domain-containing protein|nr:PVC-type heme-binding CxxCH protein [Tepidisphaeraceae bacterium]
MKTSSRNSSSTLRAILCAALCAFSTFVVKTAPAADKTPDPNDPEAERQSFKLAEGFEINLFASDPMVTKPIGMNFDSDGKLWIVSSSIYPQIKPGQVPNDKVIVLEDTTGSGKADKSTVFADGLFIPTGIAPGDGGCYVANSTEILHLKDVAGTGKADQRRVVLSGFGTEDTHHIIHAFRWGPDGRLYFNQSIYIHSHVETPWGTKSLLGSGTWRYRPDTAQLEVYCRGQVNPWGIVWDEWGQTFETDGAGGEGIVFAFPGSAFQSAVGYDKVLPGLNHGSPKYAGLEIVEGRAMPKDWQGTFLTNDFRANRICHFQLSESGSGFVSKQLPDFITTKDRAFRPIDIKMGPDGAIYIADWYNPIINHGEVDFRDPRRDHTHGRIWRVTAKGIDPLKVTRLGKAPIAELLEALRSPEEFTRMRAKATMRERGGPAVTPALAEWVKNISSRSPEADRDRLEALWTYESVDVVEPALLDRVLHAKDPHARAAAVIVLSHWAPQIPNTLELLTAAVADENPRVRLEAIRALAAVPSPQSIVIAERVLDLPMDGDLEWGLTQTARDLEETWMPAFKAGKLTNWEKPSQLARALQDVKAPEALKVLVEQVKGGQLSPEARNDVIDLIASIDPHRSAAMLFDLATDGGIKEPAARAHILNALVKSDTDRLQPIGNAEKRLTALMDDQNDAVRASAMKLAGAWQEESLRPKLVSVAEAADSPPLVRRAAIEGLAAFGSSSVDELKKLSSAPTPEPTRKLAVAGLASVDAAAAAPIAAELISSGAVDADPGSILGAFVRRAGGGAALASALGSKKVSADTARVSLRYIQSLGGEETPLNDLLRKAAGLSSGPTKLTPEQMKQTIAEMLAKGNAENGEKIFRRKDTGCYQCHAIGGAGGALAPDLRAVGASSPADYLIDSVLDPNKAIKDGYQGYTIATKDGDVFSGIKVRQDDKEVVLRDATHDVTIPLASIKQQKDAGSLMPTGLADTLTHQEFLDLIRFLSELGKPGPFGPDTAQIVRRWRVLQYVPAIDPPAELPLSLALDNSNWQPAYAMVSGELPPSSFTSDHGKPISWARADLDASSAGKVRALLNDAKGLNLWLNGKQVEIQKDMTIDLPAGVSMLIFRVDFSQRGKEGLRMEVQDIPGSKGHAQPVGGR